MWGLSLCLLANHASPLPFTVTTPQIHGLRAPTASDLRRRALVALVAWPVLTLGDGIYELQILPRLRKAGVSAPELPGFQVYAAETPALASSKETPAKSWCGVFSDPLHPRGYRALTAGDQNIIVTGVDEPGRKPWRLVAPIDPDRYDMAVFDFKVKGGPRLKAQWVEDGIKFQDGNKWTFEQRELRDGPFLESGTLVLD